MSELGGQTSWPHGDEPEEMLLVDGGVIDNLGVNYFFTPYEFEALVGKSPAGYFVRHAQQMRKGHKRREFDDLVVINASPRFTKRARLGSVIRPLKEVFASAKLLGLPYKLREVFRRRELNESFISACPKDGTAAEWRGVLLNIEHTPLAVPVSVLVPGYYQNDGVHPELV